MPNITALNKWSTYIAYHTPITPISNHFANTKDKPTLNTHIEITDSIIGYFTSLAARKEVGRVNAIGQIVHTEILFIYIIFCANDVASCDKPYNPTKPLENMQSIADITIIQR